MLKIKEFYKSLVSNKNVIYILLFFFSILMACLLKDYDYDLYARLIVGETFIEKGVFNYQDFLSYTPTHNWYDHEWGSGVVFYLFLKYLGNFGLVLLQGLLMFTTAFFAIKVQQLQKNPYPTSLLFMSGFLWLFAHQNPSVVRCHLFSFMFFTMFLYFLEKTRKTNANSNILWLCPFLVVIWNNLHGGVVAGLGLIFIYMICELLSKRPWLKYLYVLLVSTPALIINPYGIKYLDFLISANTMQRKFITEWWTVFAYRHIAYYYPIFSIGICTLIACLSRFFTKKIHLAKFTILLVTVIQGIMHVKLLSLTLIIVVALYYNEIMHLVNKKAFRILEKMAYPLVFLALFYIPFTNAALARTDITKFPVLEVEFLKANNIKGNILCAFEHGSYISYKLYPDNLIYMDGRYEEVYNNQEFNRLMNFELINHNWEEVFKLYPTEILLIKKNSPVYNVLKEHKNWKLVFEGGVSGVFLPTDKVKKYKEPISDYAYYRKTEFDNLGYFRKQKIKG